MTRALLKTAHQFLYEGKISRAYYAFKEASKVYGLEVVGLDMVRCLRRSYEQHCQGKRFLSVKPKIVVLLKGPVEIAALTAPDIRKHQPFELSLFYMSVDGARPVHQDACRFEDVLAPEKHVLPQLPVSDFCVYLGGGDAVDQESILQYLEFRTGIAALNNSGFMPCEYRPSSEVPGRVSVIIPTYKRPDNLRNAIESVLRQDYPDIELIVVSDNEAGSAYEMKTSKLLTELKSQYPASNIQYVAHSRNRNGAAARNTGLLRSSGEYVCFLDDDDEYLEGRISKSVAELSKSGARYGAVYCGYLGWNSPSDNPERYRPGNLITDILLLNYDKHYMHTDTITYRKRAIMRINGFDESFKRHQDLEINLRFFGFYDMGVVREVLVRLNPMPNRVDNRVYDDEMVNLKLKFFSRFKYLIENLEEEDRAMVYEQHRLEALEFMNDKAVVKGSFENL
jgi:glycosyltransferase involved in cell wall biosynthesis